MSATRAMRWFGLVLGAALIAYAGLVAVDRRPLRAAEEVYLDGRQLTACATRELRPFAEEARDLEELPEALEQLIEEASGDAREVHERGEALAGGLLPGTRAATDAVREALAAQAALYDAMADDPAGSEDELVTLGRANNAAEGRLRAARSRLFAGEPAGWDRRFTCRNTGGGS